MSDDPQDALTEPVFDALTVRLTTGSKPQARAALSAAIRAVPGVPANGWRIRRVHRRAPRAYDLLPPAEHTLSVRQAFDLKYQLEGQTNIELAEALFVTNVDNEPEPRVEYGLEGMDSDWRAALRPEELNPVWSLGLVRANEAWERTRGEGVLIGHPDSGYIPHPALDDGRIRHDLERDFFDADADARNPEDRGGNHGLSTAGVIMGGGAPLPDGRFVWGVAPEAQIVPMRITRKGPPVFLLRSGPRMVRDAVYHAIDCDCHIISMSMGGVGDASLHLAIREAVRRNLLVLAAAGNYVRIVVWPALYPETIAVAACDVHGRPWEHSSHGTAVDVTAPGQNIWRAFIDETGAQNVRPSNGTSYAVATTAGAAALWLAHHGRDTLLARYAGIPLQEVFRRVLRESCNPLPQEYGDGFGAGVVNAARLLQWPLPDPQDLATGGLETVSAPAPGLGLGANDVAGIVTVFDSMPEETVRRRLATMTELPEPALDSTLAGVGDELLFHIVTNPSLRRALAGTSDAGLEAAPDDPEHALQGALWEVTGVSSALRQRVDV